MTEPRRDRISLREVIARHLARYPGMRPADLYKLLHQAVFGSEHAVGDPARAREQLLAELAAASGEPEEPLLDPISDGGEIARVHLRTYRAAGLAPDPLVEAFVRTASVPRGSKEAMEQAWRVATEVSAGASRRFDASELTAYFARRAADGFPAARHSDEYRRLYAPSYRVVRAAWLFPAP
jgi:hypothetical protein